MLHSRKAALQAWRRASRVCKSPFSTLASGWPTFFLSPDATQPRVAWSVRARDGRAMLVATNGGDKRLQLADLKVKGGGRALMVGKGLAGYVLGHSTRAWALPAGAAGVGSVSALSDHGPINAPVAR